VQNKQNETHEVRDWFGPLKTASTVKDRDTGFLFCPRCAHVVMQANANARCPACGERLCPSCCE